MTYTNIRHALELMAVARSQGIRLQAYGNRLDVEAPAGILTDDLRAALVERKRELLALLARPARSTRAVQTSMAAIPTRYRGIQFRSRLEAKWAAFFDLIEWPWEYEPFDLQGYIPDFVLQFPHGQVLVEVKPVSVFADIAEEVFRKIERTWDGEALIVGIGPSTSTDWDCKLRCGWISEAPNFEGWGEAILFRCGACDRLSYYHGELSYHCRYTGCHDGDQYVADDGHGTFRSAWATAMNVTQWRA